MGFLATELQHFAHHANRKIIKPEDVLLCARKHPSSLRCLQKFQREHASTATSTIGTAFGQSKKRKKPYSDFE
ncbi:TPA: hypothetical protein N0F65_006225 [Lagenidium giganteum]|uniref:Centromere protein S n=1 Tax=Lagenidium giganteum TaxID=4803 RepID=A0AAV2Z607_9STRA|nr:TPA: hypothetical protein N0F65_006225 [Lagenidium giganteum]